MAYTTYHPPIHHNDCNIATTACAVSVYTEHVVRVMSQNKTSDNSIETYHCLIDERYLEH